MFTAVSIVRVIMIAIVNRWKLKTLRIEPLFGMKLVPEGTNYQVRERPVFRHRVLGVRVNRLDRARSSIRGLNYGVDFRGGIQMEVVTSGPADLAPMRGEPRRARIWARSSCRSTARHRACSCGRSASRAAKKHNRRQWRRLAQR